MKSIIIIISVVFALPLFAQHENRLIRKGNNSYEEGDYKEAEVLYLKSQQKKEPSFRGVFNLGDAWYQQQNFSQAAAAFDSVRQLNINDDVNTQTYYNLGNSLLKLAEDTANKEPNVLPASIEAYKQALRLNPGDHDAKYNLAYAQNLLDQQQQQQQNQDQNQDQQDQQNEDQQQEQQQNENQQDQQQEQQQDQQQEKQEQQQQQQQQQQQISKEDAERMLEAMKNDEKETMEKLQKAKAKVSTAKSSEKDW